ncbi:MAG: hypothetical protein GDA50_06510 [Alphaproteobacteria bacterium GM202ARS2]|nr:hypothetical protein [Alphaproteobacteria bacterium GM202ARS2]
MRVKAFTRQSLSLITPSPMALMGWVLVLWVMGVAVVVISQGGYDGQIQAGAGAHEGGIDVVVRGDGTVGVNGIDVPRESLVATLRGYGNEKQGSGGMVVRLYGASDVAYGSVVSVIEMLRSAGFSRMVVMSGVRP